MSHHIQILSRPEKEIKNQIVAIAKRLTGQWFTQNVPEDIEKDLLFQDAICFFHQGKIASFIVFTSLDGAINITLMGTHPDHRNEGFGSILLNRLFQHAKGLGYDQVVAFTVPPDRKPAYGSTLRFYQKHGFVIRKRYNELWESGAIELVKEL